jgi:predicted type IV restriction endonuclease
MGHYLFNFSKKGATKGQSLREQAGELLNARMWGIGAKTPNRSSLSPGDRVLIYVGAPEYEFIGCAELASGVHTFAEAESARYPGSFDGGVQFRSAESWSHPVPINGVLSRLLLKKTNPRAQFFSGVVRITSEDYETVVSVGAGELPLSGPDGENTSSVLSPVAMRTTGGPIDPSLLFRTVERLKPAAKLDGSLSEYDTRAEFIDKYLEALGYNELGDIRRGSPVDSGSFPDYVLRVRGNAAIAIEAKKLGAPLGAKEAAQVVAYCSNLGVRWGAVTDGRYFKLYDAPMLGVPPEERRVLSVDLADYRDRDDFEARIYPELELIAKSELESGAGLERRVALEGVRELLTSSSGKTIRALRKELEQAKSIKLSAAELSELVSELLG